MESTRPRKCSTFPGYSSFYPFDRLSEKIPLSKVQVVTVGPTAKAVAGEADWKNGHGADDAVNSVSQRPCLWAFAEEATQRTQYPLIKEYTLNHNIQNIKVPIV